jgi:hypothetical protein
MKYLPLIALMILPGCTTNLAWRGVVIQYHQKATTEGKIENQPKAGDNSIAADKQFDADAAVSTDSGSATNTPTGGIENKAGDKEDTEAAK